MFSGMIAVLLDIAAFTASVCFLIKYERALGQEYSRKIFQIWNGLLLTIIPVFCRKSDYGIFVLFCCVLLLLWSALKFHFRTKADTKQFLYLASKSEVYEEPFFLSAVIVLMLYTKLEPFFYMVPVLILTICNSVSRIIGEEYGKILLNQENEKRKTLLEFFAFWSSSYLILLAAFLCYDQVIRTDSILAASLFSVSLAVAELVSMSGLANLIVPIMAYLYLRVYEGNKLVFTVQGLVGIMLVLMILLVLVLAVKEKVTPLLLALLGNCCLISFLCCGQRYMLLVMIIWHLMFLTVPFVSGKKQRAQLFDFGECQVLVLISLMAVQAGMNESYAMIALLICFGICFLVKRAIVQRGKVYEM